MNLRVGKDSRSEVTNTIIQRSIDDGFSFTFQRHSVKVKGRDKERVRVSLDMSEPDITRFVSTNALVNHIIVNIFRLISGEVDTNVLDTICTLEVVR